MLLPIEVATLPLFGHEANEFILIQLEVLVVHCQHDDTLVLVALEGSVASMPTSGFERDDP